ncbi:hypothetical protein CIC12_20320 [Burkholderia sp. SG-MS1]|uniref:LuxR C-terminal-related transcriptional regulator n=1 Tax=Paraburkholderia sp. SG-MS1 TaxID=2023741 RepID=UPI001445129E|nr:LuxR C-terminal-related transcriptional regulator [Paraburkholderia sp. SG-MS1]NKJ49038.1 hypothetical protein [Paraburkholderia sp. SG-MS1]
MKIATAQSRAAPGRDERAGVRAGIPAEPAVSKALIQRDELIGRLDEVSNGLLAILQAPAGYGKTTLLQMHFNKQRTSGTPAQWLALSSSHQDAYTLYSWLIQSFESEDRPASPLQPSLGSKALSCEAMVTHIEATLEASKVDIYIYLDELDAIAQSESVKLLSLLVGRAPRHIHLLCACRARPDIPIARLRQRGLLVELGQNDLRFSREDLVALLSEGAERISDATIDRLWEQSEGWVGALVSARQMLRKNIPADSLPEMLTGDHKTLHDFFLEEVMPERSSEPELYDFLIKTAALDRMCSELVVAVTGRENAGETLQLAESKGLFVQELDERRIWYRYHPLFASFLRRMLANRLREERAQIHARASQWYFKHTDIVPAFDHALAAEDPVRAAEILDHWCEHEFGPQASVEILTLAERLPEAVRLAFPRIMLIEAWRRDVFWQLDGSRELVATSRERLEEMEREPGASPTDLHAIRGLLTHGEMMIAAFADDMPRAEELCEILIRDYEVASLHVRGSFYTSLLYAQREQYKLSNIDRLSRLARSHFHRPTKGLTYVFCEAIVGPSQFMAGRTEVAIQCLEDALDTANGLTGKGSPVAAIVALPLSEVHYERNDLAKARELLHDHIKYANFHGFIDQMIAAWPTQAKLLRLDGDREGAYRVLDDAVTFSREHSFDRLRLFLVANYVKFLISDGHNDEARRLIREHGIDGSPKSHVPSGQITTRDEARALAWVRVALAENCLADAMSVAKQWQSFVEAAGAVRCAIRWTVLLAQGLMLSGERRAAQRALKRAIATATQGRFIRTFLDEGRWVESLLEERTGSPSQTASENLADAFESELLVLCTQDDRRPSVRVALPEHEEAAVYGALSSREMEILRLMGTGLLNREIGERLGMTEGSVKWYVQQIYDKIGVRRRAQVLERAYQLGLIGK